MEVSNGHTLIYIYQVHHYFELQISMSAVPVLVTPMPCVLTPVVPIHVAVILDSREMEYLVKVRCLCVHETLIMFLSSLHTPDINECLTGTPCDANATCADTLGSYTCTCNSGFVGNGIICQSKK